MRFTTQEERDSSKLTPQLMDDLLDPANTPIQICHIHSITLDQLAQVIESEHYKRAAAQIESINAVRQRTIDTNTDLQTQSTLRTIAEESLLAAADIDPLRASKDPKLAAVRARHLETARRALAQTKNDQKLTATHQRAASDSPIPSNNFPVTGVHPLETSKTPLI